MYMFCALTSALHVQSVGIGAGVGRDGGTHQRLLARRHAAAHDAEALRAQLHEQGARLVRLDRRPERSAIDDEAHLQLGALCVLHAQYESQRQCDK